MSKTALLGFCIALAVLLTARQGVADVEAEKLVQEGLQLRKEGKDTEALDRFRRAHVLQPTPRVMAQIALAEQALGRWAEAERNLVAALKSDDAWIAERQPVLEEALEKIRSHLGTLEIRTTPAGAEIRVDGERIGTARTDALRLAIGAHEIVVRASGFEPVKRPVVIAAGSVTRVDVALTPLRRVDGRAKNGSAVNGASERKTASPSTSGDGIASERPHAWRRTAAWTALAGAGVALAGGITAHVIREHHAAVYNDDSRCVRGMLSRKERCGAHLSSAETAQTWALIGYAATGVLSGISITLFAIDSSANGPNSVHVQFSPAQATLHWAATLP